MALWGVTGPKEETFLKGHKAWNTPMSVPAHEMFRDQQEVPSGWNREQMTKRSRKWPWTNIWRDLHSTIMQLLWLYPASNIEPTTLLKQRNRANKYVWMITMVVAWKTDWKREPRSIGENYFWFPSATC